jgi:aminomuconate-semialdehyde/2-hydroxymuconate-6-semialdehyde dehydrogenase
MEEWMQTEGTAAVPAAEKGDVAAAARAGGVRRELSCYIDGSFVPGARTFEKRSPVDGTVVTTVHEAGREQVDAAVASARRALRGPWGDLTEQARAGVLRRIADSIEARFEEFAEAESADTGKPDSLVRDFELPRSVANFRAFAELPIHSPIHAYQMPTPDGAGALNYALRRPLGVVAAISPWNLPLLLLTWKVAPALACGNTIVAKPSEESPSAAGLLAEVMHEAGLPPGVFNLLHGFGPESAGEFLTAHPGIDGVTFTGESATGSAIMRTVAGGVKPISFELGGKNAALVFADADLDAALEGTARSVFTNTGQVCLCTERVYVERPVFDRFVEGLRDRAARLVPGRPNDPDTTLGPLISTGHRDKVLDYFGRAEDEGATVVTGGGVPQFGDARDAGAWIEPTIWVGLDEGSRCVREEIFGPVCHIAPFDTEADALSMANDTPYGLAATVWTTNLARAHRVAARLDTGITWINSWFLRDLRTPFGGMGLSGIGREGGHYSLDFYTQVSNVCVKL